MTCIFQGDLRRSVVSSGNDDRPELDEEALGPRSPQGLPRQACLEGGQISLHQAS